MKVVICQLRDSGFDIHAEGCRDLRKYGRDEIWAPIEVGSRSEVCDDVYPPEQFECESGEYLGEFRFLPCCASIGIDESGGGS